VTDAEILAEAAAALARGERVAVATVVRTTGSTPRHVGAKMIVRRDGTFAGTICGGCVEAEVYRRAVGLLRNGGKPGVMRFTLNDDFAAEQGLRCGGSMEVYVERLEPRKRLYVVGAGHVGQRLALGARDIGIEVHVVDDHPGFNNAERFPGCVLHVGAWEEGCAKIVEGAETAVVIVTRGHTTDLLVLRTVVGKNLGYLGLIASKKKLLDFYRPLLADGVKIERLQAIRAPVGLDIGAESPEEIAVSILAEVVAVFRGRPGRPMSDDFWRSGAGKALEREAAGDRPKTFGPAA
jgi:xanthine dehydrogenase accessory factor